VFTLADSLVTTIYRVTNEFPSTERFGLQGQMRRSALSVSTNIVEGSARRSTREYVNFLNIAAGAAAETRYLAEVSERFGFLTQAEGAELNSAYTQLCAQLEALIQSLSPEP
jgi:four helix bundle protein